MPRRIKIARIEIERNDDERDPFARLIACDARIIMSARDIIIVALALINCRVHFSVDVAISENAPGFWRSLVGVIVLCHVLCFPSNIVA